MKSCSITRRHASLSQTFTTQPRQQPANHSHRTPGHIARPGVKLLALPDCVCLLVNHLPSPYISFRQQQYHMTGPAAYTDAARCCRHFCVVLKPEIVRPHLTLHHLSHSAQDLKAAFSAAPSCLHPSTAETFGSQHINTDLLLSAL